MSFHPRLIIAALVPAVVAGGLALPVVDLSRTQDRDPITPSMREIPLRGIEPEVLQESSVAMAQWSDLVHTHDQPQALGLAPLGSVVVAAAVDTEPELPLEPAIASVQTQTDPFGLVGVTASEPLDEHTRVLVRVREDDTWSSWSALSISDHAPDPSSDEADGILFGTEPLLAGEADGVQVRVDTPGGEIPDDVNLVLIDNPVAPEDADLPSLEMRSTPLSTVAAGAWSAPAPPIITRAEWGADESLRRAGPKFSGTIKAGFVHHTASNSNYTPEQAAQQVRNLYAWFTKGRKYSDIAYNFLVDRYGRIYEGRGGGIDQPVVGAHTAGFNQDTFAVSAIGNYHKTPPNPEELAAVTNAMSSLMAWKLAMHHRDPNGTVPLVSDSGAGTSKYQPGQTATALVVGGHKDIGSTSCPGKFLEPQLPAIRAQAASMIGASMFNPGVVADMPYASGEPMSIRAGTNAPVNWQMTVTSRCGTVVRTLDGQQAAPGELAMNWDLRDNAGRPVPPGVYTFSVQARAGDEPIYPWTGYGRVLATNDSPVDPCGAPESFILEGSGWGHGVGMSQWGAYAMAKEGRDATSIVTHYYTGTAVQPVQDDMDVRINLQYQVASAQVRGEALEPGGGTIEVAMGENRVLAGPSDSFRFTVQGASVGVQQSAGGQNVDLGSAPRVTVRWAGTRDPGGAGGTPTLLNVIGPKGSFGSAGHRYRYGTVDIAPVNTSSGTRLNVVNVLRVHDEYLYGISEVSNSWPEAALQAQVLAARSFALNKIGQGVRRACGCNMDNGSGPYYDQAFTGWTKQASAQGRRWVNAVNATHTSDTTGLAILHNGEPINAFYSSSSGGRTNSSRDVWGGDLPYVQSVDDPWSLHSDNPNRKWSVTVTQAQVAQAFGVNQVFKLDVSEQAASGAAKTVRATLADGSTVTRTGSQIRSALGLKSSHITAINGSGTGVAAPPPAAVTPDAGTTASGKVSLKIRPSTQPRRGTSYTLRGKVRGGGRHVIQQQSLVNGEWQTIAEQRTKKKGRYAFTVKRARPAGATFTYRVVALKKQQVVAVSREMTVTVQPKKKKR